MSESEKLQILYVATHIDDIELMEIAIRSPKVEVVRAENITQALKRLLTRRFDVCVLETRFPDGNGFDLCGIIKKLQPECALIFYTGDAGPAYRDQGIRAGADHYLAKPYFDVFIDTVNDVLCGLDPTFGVSFLDAKAA